LGIDGSLIDARLKDLSAANRGFLVEVVERNSPAGVAGIVGGRLPVKVGSRSMILGGDVIVAINDIELKNVESLQRALKTIVIGTRARLKVFRQGKTFTTEFAITERPLQPGDVPESSQSFTSQQVPGKNNDKAH
jgi:S1-C subfamily serine protease